MSALLMVLALILYSTAIISEKIMKGLQTWMIVIFSLAFSFDITGTSLMGFNSETFQVNLHTTGGLAAIIIIGLHLLWAILAFSKKGRAEKLFSRFSIYAWTLWLPVFFTGVPKLS